uniref:Uncharacterized protein n=1 Tax=Streptomyces avermitilis TaxID=33903 RepID=A0A499VNF0_STRAX|nr:hypothetical protein SAVMC3_04160 [Streptomyces avermitilis]
MEGSFELPALCTLNDLATAIRGRVNDEIFAQVVARFGAERVDGLLAVGVGGKSAFNRLKHTARRPSWTNFRLQLEHLEWGGRSSHVMDRDPGRGPARPCGRRDRDHRHPVEWCRRAAHRSRPVAGRRPAYRDRQRRWLRRHLPGLGPA